MMNYHYQATESSLGYNFLADFRSIASPKWGQFNDTAYWSQRYLYGLRDLLKGEQECADMLKADIEQALIDGEEERAAYLSKVDNDMPWNIEVASRVAGDFAADLAEIKRQYDAQTPGEIEADLKRWKEPKANPEFLASLKHLADHVSKHGLRAAPSFIETQETTKFLNSERGLPGEAKPKTAESMFQRVGLLDAKPREWLVSGFIPRNEVCNPFGRPDSFKGVVAAQLTVHIPGGVDFLGMSLKQAPAAYYAGERVEQAKRRIKGHMRRLGLPADLPCYVGSKPIDLLSKPDLEFLICNVKAIEDDAGQPLGFLVIDTQSRTMGGDENSTNDGAAYAKAIEAIRQATQATLWIIAHTGHSEEAQDRPRGSSALLGAYDVFYRHKKIDERSGEIKITIDRDGLGGKELPFAVELYDTGAVNEDGERDTSRPRRRL